METTPGLWVLAFFYFCNDINKSINFSVYSILTAKANKDVFI